MSFLTVVTVTFRDPAGLERTQESLRELRREVEFAQIIVDGDAAATIAAGIDPLSYPWKTTVLAEPPKGIYAAMNSALGHLESGAVWFLNGGDEAGSAEAVRDALALLESGKAQVVCGGVRILRDETVRGIQPAPGTFWAGLCGRNGFCHQGVIADAKALRQAGAFDTTYKFAADYDLLLKLWKRGTPYQPVSGTIATFRRGGASDNRFAEVMGEFRSAQNAHLGEASFGRRVSNSLSFRAERLRLALVKLAQNFR